MTSKNSYRIGPYRSFVEFQWALAFQWLNIQYDYEPKAFRLLDGRYYLPDFFVSTFANVDMYEEYEFNQALLGGECLSNVEFKHFYCEVKQKATFDELKKCQELSTMQPYPVIVLEKYPSIHRIFKGYENGEQKHYAFNGITFYEADVKSSKNINPINIDGNVTTIIHEIKEGNAINQMRLAMHHPFTQAPAWRDWKKGKN